MESIKVTQSALIELIPYPRHKELKRQLYDDLLNYKDKQNHTTNVKAVMTEWDIISSEIQYLKDYIIGSLKKLPLRHDWGPGGDFEFKNFWANVYRYEDWTCTHNHTTEDLTMVYFLTEGEGDAYRASKLSHCNGSLCWPLLLTRIHPSSNTKTY